MNMLEKLQKIWSGMLLKMGGHTSLRTEDQSTNIIPKKSAASSPPPQTLPPEVSEQELAERAARNTLEATHLVNKYDGEERPGKRFGPSQYS